MVPQDMYDKAIDMLRAGNWTPQQAAKKCGVTPRAVRYWMKAEGINARRLRPTRRGDKRVFQEDIGRLSRSVLDRTCRAETNVQITTRVHPSIKEEVVDRAHARSMTLSEAIEEALIIWILLMRGMGHENR